jgi:uncharacterized protein (TIGR03083 family)
MATAPASVRQVPRVTFCGDDRNPLISLLDEVWSSIIGLLEGLPVDAWSLPALPGWDVHDVVAHLVGTERMLLGVDRPDMALPGQPMEHVKNEIGRLNEAWVVALRGKTSGDLLDLLRAVTAERLGALDAMDQADFDAPSWTPVGEATYGRFMEVRVFDSWMHEQDIREAVGQPGHDSGAVVEQSLVEVMRALGYVVGKRAGAPDGWSMTIRLTGPVERDISIEVDGRARVVDELDGPPAATMTLPSTLFFRLAGGRLAADLVVDRIELDGDMEMAQRVVDHLGFTI